MSEQSNNERAEIILVSKEEMKKDVLDNDTWIGDTGASCHMTNDDT